PPLPDEDGVDAAALGQAAGTLPAHAASSSSATVVRATTGAAYAGADGPDPRDPTPTRMPTFSRCRPPKRWLPAAVMVSLCNNFNVQFGKITLISFSPISCPKKK